MKIHVISFRTATVWRDYRMTSSEGSDPQYEGWSGWENGTWKDYQEYGTSSGTIFQIVAYSMILLTGIPGNILVLTLFGRRQVDTPFNLPNYLIMSLAVSDLAVLVLYVPFYIIYENMGLVWPFGLAMCKIVFSGTHLCVYASLGTMVGIAVERYRIAFHLHVNKPLVVAGIISVWVSSFLFSIPQMMYLQLIELEPLEDETEATKYACEMVWPDPAYEKILQPVDFVLFYLLPLGIITVIYTKIVCILRRAIQKNVPNRRLAEQSRRIIRILILVGSVFAVCVFPVHFLQLSRVFYPQFWQDLVDERPWLFSVFAGLYLLTHVINPIIYALLHRKFRMNIVLMLKSSTQWCTHAVTWRCTSTRPLRPLRLRQKPEEMKPVVDQSVNILLKCIGKPRRKSELCVEDEPVVIQHHTKLYHVLAQPGL